MDDGRIARRGSSPGDPVTIVGRALPFSDLADPTGADIDVASDVDADDPEVAADLAEARASGALVDDPAAAWGNAAIPGFGIGRPVAAAAHRPGGQSAATGSRGGGGEGAANLRDRPGDARRRRVRGGARC